VVPRVPTAGLVKAVPSKVRGIGVVAAQDLDDRVDLRRRLSLTARIRRIVRADGEGQSAKPAERAADLEIHRRCGQSTVVKQFSALAERQLVERDRAGRCESGRNQPTA
jgi:hypothetical protein